jgi:hypothetical protein
MAKMAKRKSASSKRERPAERLIILETPAEALTRKRVLTTTTEAKVEFDAAHKEGMEALRRRDYEALATAIRREQAVIERVARVIESRRRK